MKLFHIFDKAGVLKNTDQCTSKTTGVVKGVSNLSVNIMHLPMVEYVVEGEVYTVRMEYQLAKKLEKESTAEAKIVKAPVSTSLNPRLQLTKIQGVEVAVFYNPDNPKKAIVRELDEES